MDNALPLVPADKWTIAIGRSGASGLTSRVRAGSNAGSRTWHSQLYSGGRTAAGKSSSDRQALMEVNSAMNMLPVGTGWRFSAAFSRAAQESQWGASARRAKMPELSSGWSAHWAAISAPWASVNQSRAWGEIPSSRVAAKPPAPQADR